MISDGETVRELAAVYLGNILYALELAAHALDTDDKQQEAAFYRGIARKLAEARGRERSKDGNATSGGQTVPNPD
ncbi:MAG: hypothetical protein NVS4B3_10590 [Gemmatimonadaceae bacterium]